MGIEDQNSLSSLKELLKKMRNIFPSEKDKVNILVLNNEAVRVSALIDLFFDYKEEFLKEIQDPVQVYVDRLTSLINDSTTLDDDSVGEALWLLSDLESKLKNYVIYPALQSYYNFPVTSSFLKRIVKIQREKKIPKYPLNKYHRVAYDPERKRLFLKCQKVMKCIDYLNEKEEDKPSFQFLKELNTEWWECMINEHPTLFSFLKEKLEKIRKTEILEEKESLFDDMLVELRCVRRQYPVTEDDLPSFLGIRAKG